MNGLPKQLTWAAFAFMGIAIICAGYEKVDFHSVGMILAASVGVFTGLAGLCLHPPWTMGGSVTVTTPTPAPIVVTPATPEHPTVEVKAPPGP